MKENNKYNKVELRPKIFYLIFEQVLEKYWTT